MKKQLFLLLCILFSVSFSAPQLLTVEQIRSEYENVQAAMKNYTKIDVADNDMSTEGGEISYYYDKQKLKVIIAKYYGETGKMNEEIYLYENYPMFVYKETYNYNTPMYDKKFDDKKTKVLKERYYFDSNKKFKNKSKCTSGIRPRGILEKLDGLVLIIVLGLRILN